LTNPKAYKVSDGNGGHLWDKKRINESVIAGVILTIVISVGSTFLNRIFNVNKLENAIIKVEKYALRSLQMNDIQNKQINSNTEIIYRKYYPGVPAPQICWPSTEEVK